MFRIDGNDDNQYDEQLMDSGKNFLEKKNWIECFLPHFQKKKQKILVSLTTKGSRFGDKIYHTDQDRQTEDQDQQKDMEDADMKENEDDDDHKVQAFRFRL